MSGSLAGAMSKWRRAKEHVDALAHVEPVTVGSTAGSGGYYIYPVAAQTDSEGLEYRFHVGNVPPFDSEPWALAAGDCIFNLPAGLIAEPGDGGVSGESTLAQRTCFA